MSVNDLHIVVIAGSQRSGTTLVGQILGSHPNALLIDEPNGLYDWANAVLDGAPEAQVKRLFTKSLRAAGGNYKTGPRNRRLTEDNQLLDQVTHLVLKAPNLTYSAAQIADRMPNVSAIYMHRDIRDVVVSMQKLVHIKMLDNQIRRIEAVPALAERFSDDLERLKDDTVSKHRKHAIVARIKMQLSEAFAGAGIDTCVLRYEDLVSDPEASTGKMLATAGLAPSDDCLNYPSVMRGWGPGFTERTRPVDGNSRKNWMDRLSEDEEAEIWSEVGGFMESLGYQRALAPKTADWRNVEETVLARPVIALGRGGGGTRLLGQVIVDLDVFLGNRLNISNDSLEWPSLVYELVIKKLRGDGELDTANWPNLLRRRAAEILAENAFDEGQRWGLKLPEVTLMPEAFATTFPDAQFVHLVRHPVDASLRRVHKTSRIEDPVGKQVLKAAYKRIGRPEARMAEDDIHIRNAASWVYQTELLIDFAAENLPADRYIEVRYEDLCVEPRAVAHRLSEFLGVNAGEAGQNLDVDLDRARSWSPPDERAQEVWAICGEVAKRVGYADLDTGYQRLNGRDC